MLIIENKIHFNFLLIYHALEQFNNKIIYIP